VVDLTRLNRAGSAGAVITKVRTGLSPLSLAVRPPTPISTTTTSLQLTQSGCDATCTNNGIAGVTIGFPGGVTSPGTMTAATTNRNPNNVPAGFSLGPVPIFYEISVGGGLAFNGQATLCIPFNYSDWPDPSKIVIQHLVSGAWVPQLTTVNYTTGQACTSVTSFSPFVLGVYDTNFLLDDLLATIATLSGNQGLINSLRVKAEHAAGSYDANALDEVRSQLNALSNQIQAQSGKKLLTIDQANALIAQIATIVAHL